MLIIAVIGPRDSTALADGRNSGTEAEGAAAGEAEGCRVELGDIVDADGWLGAGSVDGGCE